jgi:hypothetical protein
MGKIADDMTRLVREIRDLRTARRSYVQEIRTTVNLMRAEFRREFDAMVLEGRAERAELVRDLQAARRVWAQAREPGPPPEAAPSELPVGEPVRRRGKGPRR